MDDAGFHHQLAARAGDLLMAVQPEPDPAAQDLEGLVQVAVYTLPPAPGRRYRSATTDAPSVSSAPSRTTERSPLTGFWNSSPVWDMPPPYGRDGALGI
jgi:hypothetical protein